MHILYQGLHEKNSHIRQDFKSFLIDMQVSDDFLLHQVTKSTSDEEEEFLMIQINYCWKSSLSHFTSSLPVQGGVQEKAGEQAPAEQCMRCVVKDERDYRLQIEGRSERWMSGQSQ